MAWWGTITDFKSSDNGWRVFVDYWEDANPDKKITRVLDLPIGINRSTVVGAIKEKGQEVRAVATLNTTAIVGTNIQIP